MSAALSRLRILMRDELFVRSPKGLQPTPRALDLAEPISLALRNIQNTLEFTQEFNAAASTATLTLGVSEHPSYVVLPGLVSALQQEAPGISLRLRQFTARDSAIAMLDSGEIDVAIGVPPTQTARILTRPLFEERFVCIVRKDHPGVGKRLSLKRFLELAHLLVSPEGDLFGHVDAELAKSGLKRRLGLTLPQMYVAPLLVARSDLIATLMAGVVTASGRAGELKLLQPPVPLAPVPFVLSWHRRNDAHPAQRWLRDFIVAHGPPGR